MDIKHRYSVVAVWEEYVFETKNAFMLKWSFFNWIKFFRRELRCLHIGLRFLMRQISLLCGTPIIYAKANNDPKYAFIIRHKFVLGIVFFGVTI